MPPSAGPTIAPVCHELESDVEPFRSILLGLFFLAVGMLLDLSAIAARPLFVVGIALGVIIIKGLIIAGLARAFGNSWPRSVRLGLLLSQAGEFGFVLFAQAAGAHLILPEAASLFGAVVTLSMLAAEVGASRNTLLAYRADLESAAAVMGSAGGWFPAHFRWPARIVSRIAPSFLSTMCSRPAALRRPVLLRSGTQVQDGLN